MAIGLEQVCEWYRASAEASYEARKLAERDRDYCDGKQLSAEEINTLKQRGQPPVIMNRLKPKLKNLLGSERKQRTDPKAFPRTPDDEQAAEAATDAIRYVCDKNDFPKIRSRVFENMAVEGFGGGIVEVSQNKDGTYEITIKRIAWDRLFYDQHSAELDFDDSKYKGIVAWMDEDDGIALYGEKFKEIATVSYETAADDKTYDDKPYFTWVDGKRKRIKVCEVYYREKGVWYHCIYTKAGFIKEPAPSAYLDEDGDPICPIEMMSAYVDNENNRYGEMRDLISPQDEINKRRSKGLHLLNSRQTAAERGAVDDIGKMKKEMAKPDGHVDYNPGFKWEVLPTNDLAAGNLQLLQEAKAEIDSIGQNAALQGKQGAQSGRELIARQQAGQLENVPLYDNLSQWNKAIYRQVWARIKQYWTSATWVRVTDDEKKLKYVGLNQPITLGEQQAEALAKQDIPPEQKQALIQQIAANPVSQQVVGVRNDVSKMDMDIIVEDVPDTVNIQGEQFEQLVQMYAADPQGPITAEDVITASTLRNKDRILERMRAGQQSQGAERQASQNATLNKTNSETEKNLATAQKDRATAVKTISEAAINHMAPMPGNGQELAAADSGAPRIQ